MSLLSAIRVALGALLVHKGRSTLTSLGIVIGIGAVIAMVSAGEGARNFLDDRLDSVGKNLILIRPGARTAQSTIADFAPLTAEDVTAVRKQLAPLVTGVAETQLTQRTASTNTTNYATVIVGTVPDLQAVRSWAMDEGRFLTDDDGKKTATVCVLGQTVRKKLFGDRTDILGQFVRVDRLQLRVVGIAAEKGRSPIGADQDDQIFVPLSTLQHKLVGDERLNMILVGVRSEDQTDHVMEECSRILREQHHLKVGAENFDVSSVNQLADIAKVVTTTLQLLVAVVASISLVVGGIGIMNIMLVSVTERTREIGIRMAVGAKPTDVLAQFLLEAVVLALVGGVLGIVLGLGTAVGLAEVIGWPVVVSPMAVFVAFGVSAAVGVFFGYYPALKASRLDPIEALRFE